MAGAAPRASLPAAPWCLLLALAASLLPAPSAAECGCSEDAAGRDKARALRLKVVAVFCILAGGAAGAAVPSLGRRVPALRPGTGLFRAVKAFAGGVILATGLVHILPAAFDALGSPCLAATGPWRRFPFAGMVAMLAAIATLVVDTVATGYFRRTVARKAAAVVDEPPAELGRCGDRDLEEAADGHRGHAHGMSVLAPAPAAAGDELVRHRVISQVLELGVVVHSLIIGMSLGASDFPSTVRPLVPALTFHQLFEGIGLGGCIVQGPHMIPLRRASKTGVGYFLHLTSRPILPSRHLWPPDVQVETYGLQTDTPTLQTTSTHSVKEVDMAGVVRRCF
ncbi:zinc transporter 5-like isoform X2 [Panicum virgatum]|uniref:Uncharacterized protein n=1 Tax=Panicum virgatum TaxID=38727 RepID=A0A8T0UCH9_PANVG|nr:zinc transporter 5-like isoform X2 [Panicum virgatum]KAG2618643.1 hypothetical protein PVAP13_3NG079714 [Panicum virgatum]